MLGEGIKARMLVLDASKGNRHRWGWLDTEGGRERLK